MGQCFKLYFWNSLKVKLRRRKMELWSVCVLFRQFTVEMVIVVPLADVCFMCLCIFSEREKREARRDRILLCCLLQWSSFCVFRPSQACSFCCDYKIWQSSVFYILQIIALSDTNAPGDYTVSNVAASPLKLYNILRLACVDHVKLSAGQVVKVSYSTSRSLWLHFSRWASR